MARAEASFGLKRALVVAELLERKLVFVTGKGGVGRTTVACALALLASQAGKRTLICEAEPKGDLSEFLETGPTSFAEREVAPNLSAMSMNTEASLREYLRLNLRIPLMARIGPLARAFDFVATAAPGVKEILVVGKLCYEVREANWDLIVVDAGPTGQIVSQLDAPQAINQLVKVGLVKDQTGWMMDILSDPKRTGCVIVTTPEEMPVNETIELARRIRTETSVDLAAIAVNRVLPELFGRGEEEVFRSLSEPGKAKILEETLEADIKPILSAAQLAVRLRRTRAAHLERLRARIDSEVQVLYLPYLFSRTYGMRTTRQMAESLSAELGDG